MILTAVLGIAVGATANNVAHSAMLIEIIQDGSDVVANYSGSWATWTRDEAIVVNDTAIFSLGIFAMPGENQKDACVSRADAPEWCLDDGFIASRHRDR